MRKLLLALVLLAGFSGSAWANACLCSGGNCDLHTSTNWTNCGGTFPQATDSFEVQSPNKATISQASQTFTYGIVDSGATLACTDDTTARTVTFTASQAGPRGNSWSAWLWIRSGGTLDCDGSDGVTGNAITFTYSGTIPSSGANFFAGDSLLTDASATDVTIKLRGLRRTSTSLITFSQGAVTTDFIYCANLLGGAGGAANGDTIVFTTGNLKDYWCEVVTETAECNTSCSGGACDIQFNCNAANDWQSMTKGASGLGGPARAATPDDGNADFTADNTYLFPAVGDSADIFLPAVIQGGATVQTNGARAIFSGAQANMRYITFKNMSADQSATICTSGAVCPGAGGSSVVHFEMTNATSTEGDIAFINTWNWLGLNSWEINATDHTSAINGDARANRPITFRHLYQHDPYDVHAICTCTNDGSGGGIAVTTDVGTTMNISGLTVDGLHCARLFGECFSETGPQTNSASNFVYDSLTFKNFLIHDIPARTDWIITGTAAGAKFWDGTNLVAHGIHCWDLGRSGGGMGCLSMGPQTALTSGSANGIRADNVYVVNVDSQATDSRTNTSSTVTLVADTGLGAPYDLDSANVRLSNSYITNSVGNATRGGSVYSSFFYNDWLVNTGVACTNVGNANLKGVIYLPEDAIGNYIDGNNSTSCYNAGIFYLADNNSPHNFYATRTRNVVSNVISGTSASSAYHESCVMLRDSGDPPLGNDINVYNNLCDQRKATGGGNGVLNACVDVTNLPGSASSQKVTDYYNICMNVSAVNAGAWGGNFVLGSNTSVDVGYNVYHRLGDPPADGTHVNDVYNSAFSGTLQTGDVVNNSQDFLLSSANTLYSTLCSTSYRTAAPTGTPIGPLRYGINSFEYFHPAALATMNSLVYKARFNWQDCSAVYQDDLPRNTTTTPALPQWYIGGISLAGNNFASSTNSVTTTASSIFIPGSGSLNGIRVAASRYNSDVVFIRASGTATTSDLPIIPGDVQELPFTGSSISAVAASGTQSLTITGLYQK